MINNKFKISEFGFNILQIETSAGCNMSCSFCPYKKSCWGDNLQYLPQQQSKSKSPKWMWYTEVNNPRVDDENS